MNSLRTRLLIAFVVVALVGVGTVALVANRVTTREFSLYVSSGRQNRAQRLASDAADYYAQAGGWEGAETWLEAEVSGHVLGQGRGQGRGQGMGQSASAAADRVLIVNQEGRVVVDTGGELVGQHMQGNYRTGGVPVIVNGETVGTLLLTTEDLSGHSDLEKRFLDTVNQAVLWAVLLVTLAALIGAALLSRQLVAPLRQLTAASEAMAQGDLSQRVERMRWGS
jgi:methyl-accepting chemotaxis protein